MTKPSRSPHARRPAGRDHSKVIRVLNFHAGYACRSSTHCCRPDDLHISVPPQVRDRLVQHLNDGTLVPPNEQNSSPDKLLRITTPSVIFSTGGAPPDPPVFLGADEQGRCLFLDAAHDNLCSIHSQLGLSSLPPICMTFPRLYIERQSGKVLAYSCNCPTAAAMLFEGEEEPALVTRPRHSVAQDVTVFDARNVLPPKRTPTARMSWDDYEQWERQAVALLARPEQSPEAALVAILHSTRTPEDTANGPELTGQDNLRPLSPGLPAARQLVAELLGVTIQSNPTARAVTQAFVARYGSATGAAGEQQLQQDHDRYVADGWGAFSRPIRRYLATMTFVNRVAEVADGLRSIAYSIICAHVMTRIGVTVLCAEQQRPIDAELLQQAIGYSDYLLKHSDPTPLVNHFDRAENMSDGQLLHVLAP